MTLIGKDFPVTKVQYEGKEHCFIPYKYMTPNMLYLIKDPKCSATRRGVLFLAAGNEKLILDLIDADLEKLTKMKS